MHPGDVQALRKQCQSEFTILTVRVRTYWSWYVVGCIGHFLLFLLFCGMFIELMLIFIGSTSARLETPVLLSVTFHGCLMCLIIDYCLLSSGVADSWWLRDVCVIKPTTSWMGPEHGRLAGSRARRIPFGSGARWTQSACCGGRNTLGSVDSGRHMPRTRE